MKGISGRFVEKFCFQGPTTVSEKASHGDADNVSCASARAVSAEE